jgi:hypothetical protein
MPKTKNKSKRSGGDKQGRSGEAEEGDDESAVFSLYAQVPNYLRKGYGEDAATSSETGGGPIGQIGHSPR